MGTIDRASLRLERALDKLEQAADALLEQTGNPVLARRELAAMLDDRARLAKRLDEALGQERVLRALTDETSNALDAAISEIRAALEQERD